MQELCVQGLVKVYGGRRGEKRALGGVSFTLGPGFYGLLGPNGAGKSTMINIIIGNLAATKGKVLWNGRDVRRLGRQFRAVLGYMPQQQSLYDSFTGRRFLQYMAALKELPRAGVPAEVQRVARAVHLQAELEKKLAAYSGGMKQRLLAAAACWAAAAFDTGRAHRRAGPEGARAPAPYFAAAFAHLHRAGGYACGAGCRACGG